MTFYQTASTLFIGLIIAILLRFDLVEESLAATRHQHARGRRAAAILASVALCMTVGEIVSLLVLFSGEASQTEHTIVGLAALIAVAGTAGPGIVIVIRKVLGAKVVDGVLRWSVLGFTGALAVLALLVAFFGASIATSPVPRGSLNNPKWFVVYGTCAAGACGLNERTTPSSASPSRGRLEDGASVGVICQVRGALLRAAGRVSAIWDQLRSGAYVSDLYVSTPAAGRFSAGLQRCPARPITSATEG